MVYSKITRPKVGRKERIPEDLKWTTEETLRMKKAYKKFVGTKKIVIPKRKNYSQPSVKFNGLTPDEL